MSRKHSSCLTETLNGKTITYNGLNRKYYYDVTDPWVEGKEDQGIGEWIQKESVHNIDEIAFFNGYIDPNRPDLYYANSRVKELLITTESGSWTYSIEDTPNPQIIKLPRLVIGDVRFTILDVYEGNKYTDTCIGEIFFLRVRGQ
jgi:hypothetical protein